MTKQEAQVRTELAEAIERALEKLITTPDKPTAAREININILVEEVMIVVKPLLPT